MKLTVPQFGPNATRNAIALAGAGALSLILLIGTAERLKAAEEAPAAPVRAATVPASALPVTPPADEIERFCGNVADAARERRYANQARELEALKSDIDARIKQLEDKKAEYEKWMKLRQAFITQASDTVVKIYAKMKPDAAAERLSELRTDLAAAILMKLEVKQSGLIMNEMKSTTAARLTSIMASTARKEDPS